MSKKDLNKMMQERSPLKPREAITPVDLYTNPQTVLPTSPQVDKPTNPQVDTPPPVKDEARGKEENSGHNHITTKLQVVKTTSRKVAKTAKPQVDKYTTHLKTETIKTIKRAALDGDVKDYQIVQMALDSYFESNGATPN
jgi:hypothetical protein